MPVPINLFQPSDTVQAGTISTGVKGRGNVLLHNLSPYELLVSDGVGNSWYALAWLSRKIPLCGNDGTLQWKVAANPIIQAGQTPTSIVFGEAYKAGEVIEGTYPSPLPRLMNVGSQITASVPGSVTIGNASLPVTGVGGGNVAVSGTVGVSNTVSTNTHLTDAAVGIGALQTTMPANSPPANGTSDARALVDTRTSLLAIFSSVAVNNYGIQLFDGNGTSLLLEPPRPRQRLSLFPVLNAQFLNQGNGLTVEITNNDGQTVTYTPIAVVGGLPVIAQPAGGFDLVQETVLGTGFVEATGTAAIGANTAVWTVTVPAGQVLVIDSTLCLVSAFGATAPAGMQTFVGVFNAGGTELARVNHLYGQSTAGSMATGKGTKVGGSNVVRGSIFNPSTIGIGYLVSMTYHYEIQ